MNDNPNFPSYSNQFEYAMSRAMLAQNEADKISIITQAIDSVRDTLSQQLIDNFGSGIDVNNLDELKLSLRQELGKATKPLLDSLNSLKLSSESMAKLRQKSDDKNSQVFHENFDFMVVRKPIHDVTVKNLKDIKIPDSTKVTNLADLEQYFKILADVIRSTFSVEVPAPQVTVQPADVNIPAPIVNVESQNLDELLEALKPLRFLSDKPNKPLSVRLSDGRGFIKELLTKMEDNAERYVAAVSNSQGITSDEMRALGISTPRSGSQKVVTVTTTGTPHNLSSGTTSEGSSVSMKYAYLSASTDTAIIMVVGFSSAVRAASGSKNGMILIPGNEPTKVETSDLKNLWVDSETNGGKLCVAYSIS